LEKAKIKIQKMIFEVLFLDYIYTTKKKKGKRIVYLIFAYHFTALWTLYTSGMNENTIY
jgi:hypothetical protein